MLSPVRNTSSLAKAFGLVVELKYVLDLLIEKELIISGKGPSHIVKMP
jgi:hypothetical protein